MSIYKYLDLLTIFIDKKLKMKSSPLSWQDSQTHFILEKQLKNNQIVLTSTDTVIGLLGQLSQASFEQINAIKKRTDKPYLVLVGSVAKAKKFMAADISGQIQQLMATAWPGPLTLIVRAKPGLPTFMTSTGAIAIRVPKHVGLLQLLQKFDGLFSTSANLAGEPVPVSLAAVDQSIKDAVAQLVDGQQEETPSTILDCTGDTIKLVRAGAYPISFDKLRMSE